METKMEQFPATNPNPVLSAGKDGIVLYTNMAGELILNEWGVHIDEKLPSYIVDVVQRVISLNSSDKIEVKAGNHVYLVSFHPLPEEECVNIYGFDISEQKELELKLSEAYENLQMQSEELQVQNEELQAQSDDLHEAYETLHESEEHYRMLFENMTEAFYLVEVIYDKNGKPYDYRFLEVNPAYESNMGIKKEQMLGKSLFDVFPNASPITIEKYNEIAISGQSAHFEVFSQAVNGKYLDVYAFSPEKGKLAVIFRDITKRKRMEEALEESETQYRMLFEKSMDGIILSDPRGIGIILSANPAACRMLGWAEEELILKGLDVIFDVKNPALSTLLDEHIPSGSAKSQINYRRKDGTSLTGEVSSTFFIDRNGAPRAVTILRDITERKRVEKALHEAYEKLQAQSEELQVSNEELKAQSEELHEAHETLWKNEQRLEGILNSIQDGFFELDHEWRYT